MCILWLWNGQKMKKLSKVARMKSNGMRENRSHERPKPNHHHRTKMIICMIARPDTILSQVLSGLLAAVLGYLSNDETGIVVTHSACQH
jgi:hypothetical protein